MHIGQLHKPIILGYSNFKSHRSSYFFNVIIISQYCYLYVVTVLGNSFIMCIIYLARRLHTAKYIAVFHLAFSDLCGSSALIPKLIDIFLFEHQDISYDACLANMFFVFHFMNMQSLTLLVLAYDRLVAICFPLQYHVIVTKPAMFLIIGVMWIFSVTFIASMVILITRLSICGSNVVNSYFFLLKIAQGADRIKAMKTCTSHFMLVAIFYVPLLVLLFDWGKQKLILVCRSKSKCCAGRWVEPKCYLLWTIFCFANRLMWQPYYTMHIFEYIILMAVKTLNCVVTVIN
uniref:G-protein coupled receptors family 1 profile domain-containing protein n=1 Tax=Cyprinus carpio TaxID=7962 RepID=A0A8C1Z168_CYPCA